MAASLFGSSGNLLTDASSGCAIWDKKCKRIAEEKFDAQVALQQAALLNEQGSLGIKKTALIIGGSIGAVALAVLLIFVLKKR